MGKDIMNHDEFKAGSPKRESARYESHIWRPLASILGCPRSPVTPGLRPHAKITILGCSTTLQRAAEGVSEWRVATISIQVHQIVGGTIPAPNINIATRLSYVYGELAPFNFIPILYY